MYPAIDAKHIQLIRNQIHQTLQFQVNDTYIHQTLPWGTSSACSPTPTPGPHSTSECVYVSPDGLIQGPQKVVWPSGQEWTLIWWKQQLSFATSSLSDGHVVVWHHDSA